MIGVNTLILGGDQGIAIPAYLAEQFVNQVISMEVPVEVQVWVVASSTALRAGLRLLLQEDELLEVTCEYAHPGRARRGTPRSSGGYLDRQRPDPG